MNPSGLSKGISLLIFLVLLVFPFLLWGQITFSCQVNENKVELQSSFLLMYVVENGELEDIQLPKVAGLRIDSRPGVESSVSIVNGKRSGYIQYSYSVFTEKEGSITIPPAKARISGKSFMSNPVTINVTKGSSKDLNAPHQDVFFKAVLSKDKVYLGEQTHLLYDIYTSKEIINAEFEKMPQFSHVFVKPLEKRYVGKNIMVHNKNYYTQTIESFVLYAQKSGRHLLGKVPIQYKYEVGNSRNPFFKDLKVQKYYTNDLTLEVVELPKKDVPYTFSGGVGDFSFSVKIAKQTLSTNEALKVEMVIKGDGDPKFWSAPKWEDLEDVEFYEPNLLSENVKIENGREYHTRVYEYLLQVKQPMDLVLQPKFSYFSPESEKYLTLEHKPTLIKVLQGEYRQEENIAKEESILENFEQPPSDTKNTGIKFLFLILGFSLISGIIFWILRKKRELKRNSENNNKIQAKKHADQCLARAKVYKETGENRLFFEEVSQTLTGYFKHKLNLENEELEKIKLVRLLRLKNIPENNILIFEKIYGLCELALFAGQKPDIANVYDETRELITSLEIYFTK